MPRRPCALEGGAWGCDFERRRKDKTDKADEHTHNHYAQAVTDIVDGGRPTQEEFLVGDDG